MSAIREELTLSDKFSGALDRYIRKMEQAAARTVESQTAADRMTAATEDMVKNLSGLEGAVHSAFTDNEADAALKRLQKEMERTGLVWTNEADRMESADLLVRVGLERLAEEGRIAASAMAEEAARADQAAAAQELHEGRVSKLTKALFGVASGAKSAVASMLGFNKAKNPIDSINNRLSRTILYFFSVRKLIRYVTDAIERAPNDTAGSFTKLKSMASDTFARTIVSAMASMKDGVDQLNAAMESDAGQKFMRGLETTSRITRAAVGFLFGKAASLVEWMGNNYQTVMTVAVVVTGLFAAKMLTAAAATAAANLPFLMMVGLAAAFVVGMQKLALHLKRSSLKPAPELAGYMLSVTTMLRTAGICWRPLQSFLPMCSMIPWLPSLTCSSTPSTRFWEWLKPRPQLSSLSLGAISHLPCLASAQRCSPG